MDKILDKKKWERMLEDRIHQIGCKEETPGRCTATYILIRRKILTPASFIHLSYSLHTLLPSHKEH